MIQRTDKVRGMTLIELMVWAALALVIVGIAIFFFIRLLDHTRKGLRRGEAHSSAVTVLSRLTQELSQVNASGVTWEEIGDPPTAFVVSLHPSEGATEKRQPTFKNQLKLFRWKSVDREVVRGEAEVPNFDPLVPYRPDNLAEMVDTARSSWLLVGEHIIEFRLSNFDETLDSSRVQGVVKIKVKSSSLDDKVFQLNSTVTLPTSY